MHTGLRIKLVWLVIAAQVVFFAGWYAKEAGQFGAPVATILVKPEPYDPRDLLSGQYIRLNYSFSNTRGRWDSTLRQTVSPEWAGELPTDYKKKPKDVWLLLHEVDGFYEPKAISPTRFKTVDEREAQVKGRYVRGRIEYGIEKYFVPEGTKEPSRDAMTIELDIYENGKPRISQVFVDGTPWP